MTDKDIIRRLALERCRLHVSHLCALYHLSEDGGEKQEADVLHAYGLFESLNRDLTLIETLIAE